MRTFLHLPCAAWLLLSVTLADFAPNSHAQTNTASLPTNIIGVGVAPITDISLITNHFAWIALTNVSAGYSVSNGYYPAWCVEGDTPFSDTNWFSRLYDSLGTNLPVALLTEPWPEINYILNHKLGGALDIQFAIWYVQDGTPLSGIDPGPTQDMVAAARQYGTNFFPSPGQLHAVVVDPTARVQRLVLEIVDPIPPPPVQFRIGILSTNNTVILSWPSSASGFVLQEINGGVTGLNWSNAVAVPTDNGTSKSLLLPASTGSRFYRLYKP